MAKAKVETNNEYLDASVEDFSANVARLIEDERAAYEILKAAKAKVVEAVRAEMPVAEGREVKTTAYTRWGQWQIVLGDKVVAKAASGARRSLADYLAAQGSNGHAV